jgi:hypothetical protein
VRARPDFVSFLLTEPTLPTYEYRMAVLAIYYAKATLPPCDCPACRKQRAHAT